ncbi:hypothetical protein GQ53DRAFT_851228 [Thozetella sp. PMI_491]|nr:hypothetical protein GQ53DRAFT_851228 [Thozetella sp. PMI_491]
MPDLEDITYSRSATIAAVTDYYQFLVKMYLKDSQVIYPPTEGWPSITHADPSVLATLGKSEEVISLLAHLPYIRSPGNWNYDAEGYPGSLFADWQHLIASLNNATGSSSTGASLRITTEGHDFTRLAPSHVVGLMKGGRETPVMILDTKLGIVHWDNCPEEIENDPPQEVVDYEPDDDVPDDEADWRYSATAWSIPDFFEVLKEQFCRLHWVPISSHSVWSASWSEGPEDEGMVPMLQDIYRQHGWPQLADYRKSECLDAVEKALEDRYPSCVDRRGK